MKKYLSFGVSMLILLGASLGFTSAYQQQGFNQYQEVGSGVSFWCQSTCVMLLGDKGDHDLVSIHGGTHEGTGMMGYGYLINGQIYPAIILPISAIGDDYEWNFSDDQSYSQLPAGKFQIAFLVVGPLKVTNAKIQMSTMSSAESLSHTWRGFWKTEAMAPYSINLHYGPKVGTWSWPAFGLLMVVLATVVWALLAKKVSMKKIVTMLCVMLSAGVIVGGIRLVFDDVRITNTGIKNFSSQDEAHKTFFDLRNYITVTDKVRQALHLDDLGAWKDKKCTIYAKSDMSWPFDAHWASVYLRPCEVVQTGSIADYQLYYHIPPLNATGSVILTGDDFALFDNTAH